MHSHSDHNRRQIRHTDDRQGGQSHCYLLRHNESVWGSMHMGLVYPSALAPNFHPSLRNTRAPADRSSARAFNVCRAALLAGTCSQALQARTSRRDIGTTLQEITLHPNMSQKRHFPYYSAVPEIEIKKRGISGVNPGREYVDPRTFVPGSQYSTAPIHGSEVC